MAIQLFRYLQAPKFILSYSIKKAPLVRQRVSAMTSNLVPKEVKVHLQSVGVIIHPSLIVSE
ncbi:hypothetical protein J32TS6_17570 [Virgibacillus pantothenticus]|nr:hypothetical protein J32TS6_17570 [Virgibacillus pantothenticus]